MHFRVKGLQKRELVLSYVRLRKDTLSSADPPHSDHVIPTPTVLICQTVSKSNNQHQNPSRMCQIFAEHCYLCADLKAIKWR